MFSTELHSQDGEEQAYGVPLCSNPNQSMWDPTRKGRSPAFLFPSNWVSKTVFLVKMAETLEVPFPHPSPTHRREALPQERRAKNTRVRIALAPEHWQDWGSLQRDIANRTRVHHLHPVPKAVVHRGRGSLWDLKALRLPKRNWLYLSGSVGTFKPKGSLENTGDFGGKWGRRGSQLNERNKTNHMQVSLPVRSGKTGETWWKDWLQKVPLGFPGGAVVENLPADAGDTGSSPGLGRSHMPWSN